MKVNSNYEHILLKSVVILHQLAQNNANQYKLWLQLIFIAWNN